MSWFDEQMKARKAADRVNFDAARASVENAVHGHTEDIKHVPFKDVVKYLKLVTNKREMFKLLFFNILLILASTITPMLTMQLIDGQLHMKLEILLISAAVLELALSSAKTYFTDDLEIKKGADFEEYLVKLTLALPNEFFNKYSSGDIAGRIDLAGVLSAACYSGVLEAVFTGVLSLIFIIEIAYFGQNLFLAGVALVLITLGFLFVFTNKERIASHQRLKYETQEAAESISIISGIQKIRLAGSERRVYTRWGNLYSKIVGFEYAPPATIKFADTFICIADIIGTLILYLTAYEKGISAGAFFGAAAAYGLLSASYGSLLEAAENIANLDPIIQMLKPIVETEAEANPDESDYLDLQGDIEIKDLHFSYDKVHPIIDGIDLKIKNGEFVAICGESGCGKSTLLKLLLGFEEPDQGEILFDGKNIKEFNIKSLRKSIGTVLQDGKIIHDDIRNNVLISAPHLSDSDVYDALNRAQFSKDLEELPMGLDTYLAEGSGGLSGGQRQRLLIARALVARPKNLLLDEATSALDNVTQRRVSEALEEIKCTRVVVAHRLSTIKNADKIILLAGGKIAEIGTYDELIAKNGVFANLVKRQRLDL